MPTIARKVNGANVSHDVPANTLPALFLSETLNLSETYVGCDTGHCGAWIVYINGESIKSCSNLAAQLDGADVPAIEGNANGNELHPTQHALDASFSADAIADSIVFLDGLISDIHALADYREHLIGQMTRWAVNAGA